MSLVDETYNNNFPCSVGTVAAGALDGSHSGPIYTGPGAPYNYKFAVNTSTMESSPRKYALCYTEGIALRFTNCTTYNMSAVNQSWIDQNAPYCYNYTELFGNGSATWVDSAIRLTLSEVYSMQYDTYYTGSGLSAARYFETSETPWTFNVMPQTLNTVVLYIGDLVPGSWLSFVDVALNSNNPCLVPTIAAAVADATHSGAIMDVYGNKTIVVPQTIFLDENKNFAICYATGSGSTSDMSWRDSYMRIRMSMVNSIIAHSVTHTTTGHIASLSSLLVTYTGNLANNMWISFVEADASDHHNYPCSSAANVAAGADSVHSGVMQSGGSDKTFTFDTTGMDTLKTFSVCYTDADGDATATWVDSALRITVGKLSSVSYWNPARVILAGNQMTALNVLPQVPNVQITYAGVLDQSKWLSLVDVSLNNLNPCYFSAEAGHAADSLHSGPIQGNWALSKTIVIPQTIPLDYLSIFAICYAENDGTTTDLTWRDSYIRTHISQLESLVAHSVTHRTTGHLANNVALSISYGGTLANNKWFSLVDQTLNNNFPCADSTEAGGAGGQQRSGPLQGGASDKMVTFDTGSTLGNFYTYAVCYTTTFGSLNDPTQTTWHDSAVRVTIGTVTQITYLGPPKIMKSAAALTTWSILPHRQNIEINYVGNLGIGNYLSFVDQSLNGNNPCGDPTVAAALADELHSGALQAAQFTKMVTLPQTTSFLNATKIFTTCYASTDGSDTDSSWRDSYIRFIMSKVESVVTTQVSHRSAGHIGNSAKLAMTYSGTLENEKYLSLVSETYAGSEFPCGNATTVAGQPSLYTTGSLQAEPGTKLIWMDTTALSNTLVYAVCYSETGTNTSIWIDAAIRLTISTLNQLTFGEDTPTTRKRTMSATDLPSTFSILPQVANVVLTYAGPLGPDKYISFVDVTLNSNNPCGDPAVAAAPADSTHSGMMAATGYDVTLPQSVLLQALVQFAVCYASTDGSSTDTSWRDSYIRFQMSEINSIEAHTVNHAAFGHLAKYSNLAVTYHGGLANYNYLSFVLETLNDKSYINPTLGSYPCENATIASWPTDIYHSGASRAGLADKTAYMDTSLFDVLLTYAVCYTSGTGDSSASWVDTGIRLTVSKVTHVHYGTPYRYTYPTNTINNYHRVAQSASTDVFYYGDLPVMKWLSLIEETQGNNKPCADATVAAASLDAQHSGSVRGDTYGKFASFDTATLNFGSTFALCYAETDGSTTDETWRDSYIRLTLSKLRGILAHSVTHLTRGHLANVNSFEITGLGTIATNTWISMVDQVRNSADPCAYSVEAAHSADTVHSGALQLSTSNTVTFDSTTLSKTDTFAVCYSEDNTQWHDSAIRLTIGTLTTITFSPPGAYLIPRVMTSLLPETTFYILPQMTNLSLTYAGELATGMYVAMVALDLYPYNTDNGPVNPCVVSSIAGAPADALHSGAILAANNTKSLLIPQTTFLSQTRTFAFCYSTGDGSSTDTNWQDSYIRTKISMIENLEAQGIQHRTIGHIASFTALSVTYNGYLGNGMWLGFVDASLNSAFPCSDASQVTATPDSTHSGSLQAGATNKVVTLASVDLDTSVTYAACYTDALGNSAATWVDSAIRITVSKLSGLKYDSGRYKREFTSTNTPDASYVIPQSPNILMEYVGQLTGNMYISVVKDSLNNNNPCVDANDAAAVADVFHSGPIQGSTAKTIIIPQTTALLDIDTRFALCYAEGAGDTFDNTWRDSYIRMRISKLYKIISKQVPLTTWGHIDATPSLDITIYGGLSSTSYISLIQKDLNTGLPCAASVAALTSDTLHSGAAQAAAYVVNMDTSNLDPSQEFAVCYAEVDGTASDTWRDSGIRLTLSRMKMLTYGQPSRSFTSATLPGNDRLLPSAPEIQFTYTGILPVGSFVALVDQTVASNNPCMTPAHPGASANSTHSGVGTTAGANVITLNTNSLDPLGIYALCYTDGTGTTVDPYWRDSYLRITMQRVKMLRSGEVQITTYGTFAFADKLEVVYEGRLDQTKWMSFVAENENGGNPCGDPTVAAHASDTAHSGSEPAGHGNKIIYPIKTDGLTGNQQFAVCYAENTGDATDTWVDTGLRLRFFGWNNFLQSRYVSGAASLLTFTKNEGIVAGDLIAILPENAQTTCADSTSAIGVTDGSMASITLTAAAQIALTPLNPGYYFMCHCSINGFGGTTCRNANGGYALLSPGRFTVIDKPRLGNLTNPGDLRAVTGRSHAYYVKGGTQTAFVVSNADKLFFAPSCNTIPTTGDATQTVPLSLTGYASATKSGYVTTPTAASGALEADGNNIRVLVACFATKEAVSFSNIRPPAPGDYVQLQDTIQITPVPRLGALSNPGDVTMTTASNPSYRLHNFYPGDQFFFGSNCISGVPAGTESSTGLLVGFYDSSTGSAMFNVPSYPLLTSLPDSTRTLQACFAPARSDLENSLNWYTMQDVLKIIPDPSTNLVLTWKFAQVDLLDFSGPAGHAAQEGDTVLLQKDNCENAHILDGNSPNTGITHSAPMKLEPGAVAATFALAEGKVNELAVGTYVICYAPSSSEVDAFEDFKKLDVSITLTATISVAPTLMVPDSVALGVDIVVVWNATDGLYSGVSVAGSWVGLFVKGDCNDNAEFTNKCYLIAHELPVGETGGVIRFPQSAYKNAGEYEVRYFRGNSRSGQGQVCAGLQDSGTGTYLQCALEAAATSSPITVYGSIESQDDLASIPGLEHVVLV